MKPEDIRKLYRAESEATPEEAAAAAQEARTDPDQARRLLLSMYALAGEDVEFERLLQLILQVGTMQLIADAAHKDDRFALHMAELITDAMEQLKPGSMKVPRGKPRKASSA